MRGMMPSITLDGSSMKLFREEDTITAIVETMEHFRYVDYLRYHPPERPPWPGNWLSRAYYEWLERNPDRR